MFFLSLQFTYKGRNMYKIMLQCFLNVCKQFSDHDWIRVTFINWEKRTSVMSLVGWKLVLIFWGFSWKGDYDVLLSRCWHILPPAPTPVLCSRRHSLSLWRVLRLCLGSVLVHSLQTCTSVSTRKTLVPSRRAVSVRTWKTQSADYKNCPQIWRHLPFEQNLNLWGSKYWVSDELFFLFANHGSWS